MKTTQTIEQWFAALQSRLSLAGKETLPSRPFAQAEQQLTCVINAHNGGKP